jgi:endonuclease/exonuclease/phosphatase family metal-dependent hydrolase
MKEGRRTGILGWILGIISIVFAIALLLSYTALYFSPDKIWFIPFLGMAFPYLAITNAVFLIIWILKWKRFAWYSLIALAVGFGMYKRYFNLPKESTIIENSISVSTYNVHVFGRWKDGETKEDRIERSSQIADYLKSKESKIVCFQEFYTKGLGDLNNKGKFKRKLDAKHVYMVPYLEKAKGYYIATFSKFPIVNKGNLPLHSHPKNYCIFTDIEIEKGRIIRVYNVHLKSLNINSQEYLFTGDIDLTDEAQAQKVAESTKSMVKSMKHAFEIRADQVHEIQKHIKDSPYPVMILGDFNDTPTSYAYQALKEGRSDAFIESGKGFSETYVGKFPSFRIDYILHDETIKSCNYERGDIELSDHYPVSANFHYTTED